MPKKLFSMLVIAAFAAGCVGDAAPRSVQENNESGENNEEGSSNGNNGSNANNGNNNGEACAPTNDGVEVCDGADNDCNGEVDDVAELGQACTRGTGACQSEGVTVCAEDGSGTVCDAEVIEPSEELCDGIDNDCDGSADEDFFDELGSECSRGNGVCEVTGTIVCASSGLTTTCDATADEPPEEEEVTCDGYDNDCDGEVDEGCDDDADGFCDAAFTVQGDPAICPGGEGDCDDTDDTVYPGAPGRCDGKDTNCDGEQDNILAIPGSESDFDLTFALASSDERESLRVSKTSSGFCFMAVGDDTAAFGALLPTTGQMQYGTVSSPNTPKDVLDVTGSAMECAGLIEYGAGTMFARRWSPQQPANATARKQLLTGQLENQGAGSWDAAIHPVASEYVIAYTKDDGEDTAKYVTLPFGFNTTTASSAERIAGHKAYFLEVGPDPDSSFELLVASFEVTVNPLTGFVTRERHVYGLNPSKTAIPIDALSGSSVFDQEHRFIGEGAGKVYQAVVSHQLNSVGLNVAQITAPHAFGDSGSVGIGTIDAQEYISRDIFSVGPLGRTWLVNPFNERVYAIEHDPNGGLTFEEVIAVSGELLDVYVANDDSVHVLELVTPGTGANGRAQMRTTQYTCH